ncbi:hypothetical protein [Agreia bicolorata]|uniref:Transmembrane protein n=1 Tax=Agreia bicolorata TaxID=110935 RepID=A0ABR5CG72_9MICO|nr:hypothetical protein [Agreia bicolorata]KJC64616.1 hypothetical protein TZ00_09745 [Agreia bicolorata]
MEPTSSTSAQPAAFTNTVLLLIAQVFAGFLCSAIVLLSLFKYDACDSSCNNATASIALYGMVAVSALTVLTSITLTVIFRRQKRRTLFIPLVGLGVMVAGFAAAMLLIDEATG